MISYDILANMFVYNQILSISTCTGQNIIENQAVGNLPRITANPAPLPFSLIALRVGYCRVIHPTRLLFRHAGVILKLRSLTRGGRLSASIVYLPSAWRHHLTPVERTSASPWLYKHPWITFTWVLYCLQFLCVLAYIFKPV